MSKHEFAAFETLVNEVRGAGTGDWASIEPEFIAIVEQFDAEYGQGIRDTGWYQAKARYFNDLVVALISNASGKTIAMRKKKKSQLFSQLDVDICYPEEGAPIIAGEVKALGTPPHPKNQMKARSGSSDLHKRAREVAFTSMDLKVAYAPPQPIGSFQSWIDSTSPGYFAFWAMRANDEADLNRVRTTLASLRTYCNGVGAVVYLPASKDAPTTYQVRHLQDLYIDRSIREMAQRIA